MATVKKEKNNALETVAQQRKIQAAQDQKDSKQKTQKKPRKAVAPDADNQRRNLRIPKQHLTKPGNESELDLQPQYMASSYKGSDKLAGKTVVITGGDSGIGRAVAILCAREGANVAIIYLNEHHDAKKTCALIEAEGGRSLAIAGNVQNEDFCRSAVKKVMRKFKSINVLINNTAFQEHADSILDLNTERLDQTFKTNIYGYFYMVQAALPHLHSGDCIINTGSVTGLRGSQHLLDYSATKGAIHAFTKALAHNLVEKGIRVNAVAPGPVWTPLNPADKSAEDIQEFGKDTHMGRPAQPEEIAPAYIFLASQSCSSYITGMVLPITGNAGEG